MPTPKPDPDLEVARRIHGMISPGTSFDQQGKVYACGLLRAAAAGVALLRGISLEEASVLLRMNVS